MHETEPRVPPRRVLRLAVVALVLLGAVGCGNHPVPVKGIVTLDGQPVKEAMVFFYPVGGDTKEGRIAAGGTDATGKYELSTLGVADGAFKREYKVVIHKYVPNRPPASLVAPIASVHNARSSPC